MKKQVTIGNSTAGLSAITAIRRIDSSCPIKEKNNRAWIITDKGGNLVADLIVVGKRVKANSG